MEEGEGEDGEEGEHDGKPAAL